MDEKTGIPQVCEAVTFAASLIAALKRTPQLDQRDRDNCERVQRMLEKAERTLYGSKE